jgi:sugar transferase (PEP-CTERM system associated)
LIDADHCDIRVVSQQELCRSAVALGTSHVRTMLGTATGGAMLRIFGHFVPASSLSLAFAELVLMTGAVYVIVEPNVGWLGADLHFAAVPAQLSCLTAVLAVLTMVALGLYSHDVFLDYRRMIIKIILAFALAAPVALLIALYFRSVSGGARFGNLWYLKAALAWFVCVIAARAVFIRVAKLDALKRRVIVIGTGERAERIRALAETSLGGQFMPVAFIATNNEENRVAACPFTLDRTTKADALVGFARRQRASEIVIASNDRRGLPIRQLLYCKIHGIRVTEYLSFAERESGRVDLDALQPSWLLFSDGFRTGWIVSAVERLFDVTVSTAILVFTLPIIVVIALLIKLDGGPIFYRQERIGQHGRPFTLIKFRSMRVDAESDGRPQWAKEKDDRVTFIGAIIRKVRIDELPQLFNVLKGDMAFIGPRPERPYFVDQLSKVVPFYDERHAVKPGISGWAQIRYPYGASLDDARQKLSYDLYYVKNRTLFLDFLILIETLRVIVFPGGAR